MKTFEHDFQFYEIKKQKNYDQMHEALNKAGAEGWEAISVIPETHGIASGYTVFLKREVHAKTVESTST